MELLMRWTQDQQEIRHQVKLVIWNNDTLNVSIQQIIDDVKDRYHDCWDETNVSNKELTIMILEILLQEAKWDKDAEDDTLDAMLDTLGVSR